MYLPSSHANRSQDHFMKASGQGALGSWVTITHLGLMTRAFSVDEWWAEDLHYVN